MSLLQIGRGVVATAASVVGLAVVVPSPVNAVPQVRGVPASSGAFWPLNPIRIVDTRSGVGAAVARSLRAVKSVSRFRVQMEYLLGHCGGVKPYDENASLIWL